jgi:hypothetical protein
VQLTASGDQTLPHVQLALQLPQGWTAAVQGYLLLIATVNGFTIDETGVEDTPGPVPTDQEDHQQAADMARDYVASLPPDRFPTMTTLADEFAFADPGERFELLIDIFVDGLSRRAARP